MKRRAPLRRTPFKRRPPVRGRRTKGRYRATAAEWQKIREEKLIGKDCRIPGCRAPAIGLHHLIGRDLLGDDVAENLIPLCGDGTTGHHGLAQELDRATCSQIRRTMLRSEAAYVKLKLGGVWLDRWYPPPTEAA